jgi:cytosolic carboxypeptidase protein 6
MNFKKNSKTFFFVILISFLWSCNLNSRWGGQESIQKVNTHTLPVQLQVKKTFDLGDGIYCSNDFAGARLNGIVLTNDTIVALITPENTPINSSPWYAFKIWSETKQKIPLKLTYLVGVKHRYYPKLSYDGLKWDILDSANFIEGEVLETKNERLLPNNIIMNLSIGPDTLWVSAQELITSKHVNKWIDELASKPFAQKIQIGKSREGRPVNLLKIGNSDDDNMIIVLSRQHPPEVSGYLTMKSFVETISGDTEIANKFRQVFNTYVIPLVNPDGVDNGHWRHNSGGIDLNRDWGEFNQVETQLIKNFMENKVLTTGGKFCFGVDFHSTWEDIYYVIDPEFTGNMPGLVPEMIDSMSQNIPAYQANIQPRQYDAKISSLSYFFDKFGAESLVFESGDETPRDLLKIKGEISAMKLMELMLDKQRLIELAVDDQTSRE